MRKTKKFIVPLLTLFASLPLALVSCGNSSNNSEIASDIVYLHVLNSEDYIDESLLTEFESQNPGVKIIYETSDTNETIYNLIQTGKANYDLINCSEYMVQRLASEELIQKIDGLDTYYRNVSPYLVDATDHDGKIDNIRVTNKRTGEDMGRLSEYAVGYMWGTLGIVYNPYYSTFVSRNMDKDTITEQLNSENGWSMFWDKNYQGVQSIKDSMRDTYALGILEVYKDYFISDEYTQEEKNKKFNSHDEESIDLVKNKLIELKDNIFGFEVDSGKNDIVTGKIGMNLAWSGDACFSILQGEYYPGEDESYEEQKPESERTTLYYAIPQSGANIWFDAWCMPKTVVKNSANYKYSIKFLDFLSEVDTVTANMSYTGYTSFCIGENDEILDYVKENYESEEGTAYDISYFFHDTAIITSDPDSFEGRTLKAMYPSESDIDRLYVMEDFGNDNNKIVQMWEDVKVNPLPVFVVVLLVAFFAITLGYLGSYKLIHKYKVKKRKELRKSEI